MAHTGNYYSDYKAMQRHQTPKRLMLLALRIFSLVLIAVGIRLGIRYMRDLSAAKQEQQTLARQGSGQPTATLRVIASAGEQPNFISIPSLKINAPIVPLGLNSDGSIAVPAKDTDVGWYKYGPAPGQTGAAVLVGHLDSATGTSIFWNLKKIKPGDTVSITKKDGATANFKVDFQEEYSQDNFPTQKVYGATSNATLRLVTCAGAWDSHTHHYTQNLVVYASMQ